MSKVFIENIGNASTTASFCGNRIGHNVNCAAYMNHDMVTIQVESNGAKVRGIKPILLDSSEHFEEWKDRIDSGNGRLFIDALEQFGVSTHWS